METVFANAGVLKELTRQVHNTQVKLVQTQFGGHMLMKAMSDQLQRAPKSYIESTQNGVAFKLKNTDGICLLDESVWHHLSKNQKCSNFVELRVSETDQVVADMLLYTPLNAVDNMTMDGPSTNYDVQAYYDQYCKAALEHEDPKRNNHSGIVKVVKYYAAAGVRWYETHQP